MNRFVLFLVAALLAPGSETWAQKNFPTVRIGIEAPAGTNSHYFVTKQLGLFQKHGINIELISFPGGRWGCRRCLPAIFSSRPRKGSRDCRRTCAAPIFISSPA